jgi:rhodanese-related sulfurtransferase
MLNAAKAEIREVDPHEVAARLDHFTLLDVREPDEYEQGALPGAIHVPRGQLEFSIEGRLGDKGAPIAVYCAGGTRSAFAAKTLQDLGYRDVVSVIGGFNRWKDEGLEWSTPHTMTQDQRIRYHRHLLLPEVGEEGQMKLLNAKVLVLGRGGHAGCRRHGRRRCVKFAAPDSAHRGPHWNAESRQRESGPHGDESGRRGHHPSHSFGGGQHSGHHRWLRHHRGRHR